MAYALLDKEKELINTLEGLKRDQKITLVGLNDFGFMSVSNTRFDSYEVKENLYQRYIYLIHKPKNKRKFYKKSLDRKDIIILDGWIDIDTESQWKIKKYGGMEIKESINAAFDSASMKEVAILWEKETLYNSVEL